MTWSPSGVKAALPAVAAPLLVLPLLAQALVIAVGIAAAVAILLALGYLIGEIINAIQQMMISEMAGPASHSDDLANESGTPSETVGQGDGLTDAPEVPVDSKGNTEPPKEITEYSKHAQERMEGRDGVGVSEEAIEDALENPISYEYDANRDGWKVVGRDATVVINPDGRVITTWAEHKTGYR